MFAANQTTIPRAYLEAMARRLPSLSPLPALAVGNVLVDRDWDEGDSDLEVLECDFEEVALLG